MRDAIGNRSDFSSFQPVHGAPTGSLPWQDPGHPVRNLTGTAQLDGDPIANRQHRRRLVEGCPGAACVLETPPMSSERRKEIDRRRRRRERALKARKHEAIKAAASNKKKR